MLKTFAALFIFMLFAASATAQDNAVFICFDEKCSIQIDGESNVSPFTCQMVALPVSDQAIPVKTSYSNGKLQMNNVKVKLPVSGFGCVNKMMTADFQKALKADEHPFIILYFSNLLLPYAPKQNQKQKNVQAQIAFKIAGVQKKYNVVFDQVEFTNDIMKITGLVKLKMSDFNVEPPQAMFGMIKTKDEIAVQFVLRFCMSPN